MTHSSVARFGVMGHPVAHSQSPFIHQEFARQTGLFLDYDKILVPLDGFEAAVRQFFDSGGHGLNITVPFKQEAWQLAQQHLSERATLAGAVNTLWMSGNALHGCNTDGTGLVADLIRLGHAPEGQRILMLGAGGAARGAIPALLDAGCRSLHIANRTERKALQLVNDFFSHAAGYNANLTASDLNHVQGKWDIVLNATSSSLDPASALTIHADFSATALAYDMVYAAHPTPFMQQARRQGARNSADGLGMLVGQAAASFAIWHEVEPDIRPVLTALRAHLSGGDART